MPKKFFYKIFTYISNTKIAGFIPLDLTLHFLIGAIITIIGLKKKFSLKSILIFLFILATLKEINDYFFHFKADWREYAGDFLVTFIYPLLIYLIRKIKPKPRNASLDSNN